MKSFTRHHCALATVNDDYTLFYTVTPRQERYTATDYLFSEAPTKVWLLEGDDKREVRMWALLKQEPGDPSPKSFVQYLVNRHGFKELHREPPFDKLIAENGTVIDLASYRQPTRPKGNGAAATSPPAPGPTPVVPMAAPEPIPPTPPIVENLCQPHVKSEHKRENHFVQIPHTVIDDDRLTDEDIRAYSVLLSYDSVGKGIYASQETLAKWLRVKSVRSVRRRLANLIDCGYLAVQRRGMQKTNIVKCLIRVENGIVIRGNAVAE